MVIFHSYVSLPEGIDLGIHFENIRSWSKQMNLIGFPDFSLLSEFNPENKSWDLDLEMVGFY